MNRRSHRARQPGRAVCDADHAALCCVRVVEHIDRAVRLADDLNFICAAQQSHSMRIAEDCRL